MVNSSLVDRQGRVGADSLQAFWRSDVPNVADVASSQLRRCFALDWPEDASADTLLDYEQPPQCARGPL